ncbi:uncharacterized protein BJ171DRAFT_601141 [Polychytrium aggregatum]|uniref:uncharacterized protein n=1 Tax=Polychytrium aggregatum TaxID=110093 RepID=UPI0022FE4843|nr:uncharacterized protein BJ171DRAFT_601141 [Polychytrium aggregatum]KAI9202216.1 hypothetical protein BJ171DRAFT_601141 [Polychytrium aggregatum]
MEDQDEPVVESTLHTQRPTVAADDLRVVAVLIKNPHMFTRSEHDKWFLRRLLRPLSLAEFKGEDMTLLDGSLNDHFFEWCNPFVSNAVRETTKRLVDRPSRYNLGTGSVGPTKLYRLTPHTRIYTFAKKYRMVFVVDVSPSMAVVDIVGKANVLMAAAYETLCKCLDGVTRDFHIDSQFGGSKVVISPDIYITVTADYGILNLPPSKYPRLSTFNATFPFRVLLQDVKITRDNFTSICKQLHDAIDAFECEFVSIRREDQKAAKLPQTQSQKKDSEPAYPPPTASESRGSAGVSESNPRSKDSKDSKPKAKPKRNEGQFFRILEHSLFALGLLPEDCMPAIVVITDGVLATSGFGDPSNMRICRQVVRQNVAFTIIQVGSPEGFTPSVNFGHVPDNEFLRFLASATSGRLLYGEDCQYMNEKCGEAPPNFYHFQLLMREMFLPKISVGAHRNVYGGLNDRSIDVPRSIVFLSEDQVEPFTPANQIFPWLSSSQAPPSAQAMWTHAKWGVQCTLDRLITVRLLEGFVIKGMRITDRVMKPRKVEITLFLPWLPGITILYTIKTQWIDTSKHILFGTSGPKPHDIELRFITNHEFFKTWMSIQSVDESRIKAHERVQHDRAKSLAAYAKQMSKMDEMMQVVTSFNANSALNSLNRAERYIYDMSSGSSPSRVVGQQYNVLQPNDAVDNTVTFWRYLTTVISRRSSSFEEWECSVILLSSQPYSPLGSAGDPARTLALRRAIALDTLNTFVSRGWGSFGLDRSVHIRLIHADDENRDGRQSSSATGFCLLQLGSTTECTYSIRLSFYSVEPRTCRRLVSDMMKALWEASGGQGTNVFPLVPCHRPLRQMIIRYRPDPPPESADAHPKASQHTHPPSSSDVPTASGGNPGGLSLTSKSFLSGYLRHQRWTWYGDASHAQTGASKSHSTLDVIYQILYAQRVSEGFAPVHEAPSTVTFYKEHQVSAEIKCKEKQHSEKSAHSQHSQHSSKSRNPHPLEQLENCARQKMCAVQYVIAKDYAQGRLLAEAWVEPVNQIKHTLATNSDGEIKVRFEFIEVSQQIIDYLTKVDCKLVSQVNTFNQLVRVAKEKSSRVEHEGRRRSVEGDHAANATSDHALSTLLYSSAIETRAFKVPVLVTDEVTVVDSVGASQNSINSSEFKSSHVWTDRRYGTTDIRIQHSPPRARSTTDLASSGADRPGSSDYSRSSYRSDPFIQQSSKEISNDMLHRYFTEALSSIADTEIHISDQGMVLPKKGALSDPNEHDFQNYIRNFIHKNMNSPNAFLVRPLKQCRVFIKSSSANALQVIIVPLYHTLPTSGPIGLDKAKSGYGMKKSSSSDNISQTAPSPTNPVSRENNDIEYFTVTMAECVRPSAVTEGPALLWRSTFQSLSLEPPLSKADRSQVHLSKATQSDVDLYSLRVRGAERFSNPDIYNEELAGLLIVDGAPKSVMSKSSSSTQHGQGSSHSRQIRGGTSDHIINNTAFTNRLNSCFLTSFCKVVYANLLQGYGIQSSDWRKVLTPLSEVWTDIDITDYLHVRTSKLVPANREANELIEEIINATILPYFKHVGSQVKDTDIYYYRPSANQGRHRTATPTDHHHSGRPGYIRMPSQGTPMPNSPAAGIGPGRVDPSEHIFEVAKTPLFLAVSRSTARGTTRIPTRDNSSPSEMSSPMIQMDRSRTTSGDSYASTTASPKPKLVEASRTCLRLNCLGLTAESIGEDYAQTARYWSDSHITFEQRCSESLLVSEEQKSGIASMISRIKNHLEEETLNCLLSVEPIEQHHMATVEHLLQRRQRDEHMANDPASHDYLVTFPLSFVRIKGESALIDKSDSPDRSSKGISELFLEEFVKIPLPNYIIVPYKERERDTEKFFILPSQPSENVGLGISLGDDSAPLIESRSRQYWLMTWLRGNDLVIQFFSKTVSALEREPSIELVKDAALQSCERANRLMLLHKLDKSRYAIDALIVPNSINADDDSEDDQWELEGEPAEPGRYSCDKVWSSSFSLHPRVSPVKALAYLSRALLGMAISNRKNMFVYQANNSYYYIYIRQDDNGPASTPILMAEASPKPIPIQDAGYRSRTTSTVNLDLVRRPSVQGKNQAAHSITIEMYGVDELPAEVISSLTEMVTGRLYQAIQTNLAPVLTRNSTAKLALSDMEFLMPIASGPAKRQIFTIPQSVKNPYLYLLYLRQNLRKLFRNLQSGELNDYLEHYYKQSHHKLSQNESPSSEYHTRFDEINYSDLAFAYTPADESHITAFEKEVGTGIAVITLALINPEGEIVKRIAVDPSYSNIGFSGALIYLSTFTTHVADTWSGYCILTEIWTHGSIQTEPLFNKLASGFQNTLLDYFTEVAVVKLSNSIQSRPGRQPVDLDDDEASPDESFSQCNFGEVYEQVCGSLSRSSHSGNPSVQELIYPLRLNSHMLEQFVTEINEVLSSPDIQTAPVVISRLAPGYGEREASTRRSPTYTLYSSNRMHDYLSRSPGNSLNPSDPTYILVAGLSPLTTLCSGRPVQQQQLQQSATDRRNSFASESSHTGTYRKGLDSIATDAASIKIGARGSVYLPLKVEHEHALYPALPPGSDDNEPYARSFFFILTVTHSSLTLFTYNWDSSGYEILSRKILRLLNWCNIRIQYLDKIRSNLAMRPMNTQLGSWRSPSPVCGSYGGEHSLFPERHNLHHDRTHEVGSESEDMYHSRTDSSFLQKRGADFLYEFVQQLRAREASTPISTGAPKDRLKWTLAAGGTSFSEGCSLVDRHGGGSPLSPADFASTIRSIRLLHYSTYPLLFTDGSVSAKPNGSQFHININEAVVINNQSAAQWCKTITENMVKQYAQYLSTLGLELLAFDSPSNGAGSESNPICIFSSKIRTVSPVVYMHRMTAGGSIVAQISAFGNHFSVTLYTMELPQSRSDGTDTKVPPNAHEIHAEVKRAFQIECIKLKDQLHVNSFSYDFHLRAVAESMVQSSTASIPIDPVSVIKAFSIFNPKRARYARSRLIHGSVPTLGMNTSIIHYILKNPELYDFQSVWFGSHAVACFTTSPSPGFEDASAASGADRHQYMIVIYQDLDDQEEAAQQLAQMPKPTISSSTPRLPWSHESAPETPLPYYLLILSDEIAPMAEQDPHFGQSPSNERYEYLASGYYINDVLKQAEQKIKNLIEQALAFYGRDSLWKQLQTTEDLHGSARDRQSMHEDGNNSGEALADWLSVLLEKIEPNSRSFTSIDPGLAQLFNDRTIHWGAALDYLYESFKPHARIFSSHDEPRRKHLILFNRSNPDYLIHLISWSTPSETRPSVVRGPGQPLTPEWQHASVLSLASTTSNVSALSTNIRAVNHMEAYTVSREGVVDDVEYEHIDIVVNAILVWLLNQ